MSEYTPTTEESKQEALRRYSHANVRDRYDADLLMAGFADGAKWVASQAACVVAEEPEWEYGIRPEDDDVPLGVSPMPTLEAALTRADNIYGGWVIVRRRKAGPWVPAKQEGADDA
ncbi:hypothetical protein [Microbacterium algeriense]|uniref:hypothetical protein n=1 Tax=Microbacterium algeriense TaxID=2615184 RepID=UPI003D71572C